ncbi:MAG: phosphatase PAP2 family protein [Vicinamibacterales bacterium]
MTDSTLLHHVLQLRTPWLDGVMVFLSTIGGGGFIWIVIGAIAAVFPARRAAAWRLILAALFTWMIVDGFIKPMVDRRRPFEVDQEIQLIDQRPLTASFPSGHAATAVAGALAGTALFPAAGWVMWPLAAAIAFTRLYLGVHWPSDVLAGALVGLLSGWLVLGGRAPTLRR